jgi:hypothetical protein
MNPVELIKRDLGPDEWQRCRKGWAEGSILVLQEELSLFRDYKIYLVRGQTQQFDFPSLPHGSYGYYAANGGQAIRLTRAGKEIERILEAEWTSLPAQNPVQLASFVLGFYDSGIKATHRVVANAGDLRDLGRPPRHYRINENALATALPAIGESSSKIEGNTIKLRAITLCGWMHDKQNLGIETIAISKDGTINLAPREVLAEKIFDQVPPIMY